MNSDALSLGLSKIPAGYLKPELFNQVARLGVLTYLEVLAFRQKKESIEVLLTKRDSKDPFWPNMYHNPGTVLRPSDTDYSFKEALNRLEKDEYKQKFPMPFFAGFWFEQLERGKGFGIVCWVELQNSSAGQYFNVNQLPNNLIKGQSAYIKNTAKQYSDYKCGKFNPTPLSQLILQ